jgi:alkanesulfonate monooxygenase SsuD/methylene tetrahydromethanopterin reductase-like flavin-dependent oxidoreductase (luciferase family)
MASDIQFGWVIQPTPRTENGAATLLDDNRKFLNALRGKFQSAWVEDHFQWDQRPVLECWTTLTYWASEFQEYVWGSLVLGQAYRNPALTAKLAATLQWLTHGRVVLGIGAGWKEDEHLAYGFAIAPPHVRVQELEEAVQIIRALWTDAPAYFTGDYYYIAGAYAEPHPNPPPPLMIGTSGEKRGLRVVAKYADWWNGAFLTVGEYAHKLEVLRAYCAEERRDYAAIKKTYFGFFSISENPEHVVHRDDLYVVGGSPDEVTHELEQLRALGVEHLMIRFVDFPQMEGLELFLDKVQPRLK